MAWDQYRAGLTESPGKVVNRRRRPDYLVQLSHKSGRIVVVRALHGPVDMFYRQTSALDFVSRVYVLEADEYCIGIFYQNPETLQPYVPDLFACVLPTTSPGNADNRLLPRIEQRPPLDAAF